MDFILGQTLPKNFMCVYVCVCMRIYICIHIVHMYILHREHIYSMVAAWSENFGASWSMIQGPDCKVEMFEREKSELCSLNW